MLSTLPGISPQGTPSFTSFWYVFFVPFLWDAQPVLFPVYQGLTWAFSTWGLFLPVMAAALQCPRTLAVHFPSEIYRSTGASQVLPELVKSLDLPNVCAVQFMPNGVARVTYKEPAQCDAALASGISFRGASLRVAPVDSRTRLVYVRDLPVEVPDDGLKVYLRAFGVVHSCVMQTYPRLPQVATGTRLVKVSLTKDLPSSASISGFDVHFWYQGQPQACPVCRSYGHHVKDCPFNGLCRRCSQPGHMARECSFRRSSVSTPAASSVPDVSVSDPVAGVDPAMSEDEDDPDYVSSSASEPGSCSGDEEVLRSVPTSLLDARARKRSAPPADESSVDLRDNELSPASDSDPVPDPVPGTPESASAVVASDPVVPDGTPVSTSAVPVAAVSESSGSKPKKKKPRPSSSAVASSLVKFFSVKSNPVKSTPEAKSTPDVSTPVETTPVESTPVESTPVDSSSVKSPPVPFWEASRRTGFGYFVEDGTGSRVFRDFGRLSRSIEIESTSFEYDRFVKYVHHGYGREPLRTAPRTKILSKGTPLEFPKPPK